MDYLALSTDFVSVSILPHCVLGDGSKADTIRLANGTSLPLPPCASDLSLSAKRPEAQPVPSSHRLFQVSRSFAVLFYHILLLSMRGFFLVLIKYNPSSYPRPIIIHRSEIKPTKRSFRAHHPRIRSRTAAGGVTFSPCCVAHRATRGSTPRQ